MVGGLSVTSLAIGLGSSMFGLANAKGAKNINKANIDAVAKYKKDLTVKNQKSKLDSMQKNYLAGLRDNNTEYLNRMGDLNDRAFKARTSVSMNTTVNSGYDINASSVYSDARTTIDTEYAENIFTNNQNANENFRRNSEMNAEQRHNVAVKMNEDIFNLTIEQKQSKSMEDQKFKQNKIQQIGKVLSSTVSFGSDVFTDQIRGESMWRVGKGYDDNKSVYKLGFSNAYADNSYMRYSKRSW